MSSYRIIFIFSLLFFFESCSQTSKKNQKYINLYKDTPVQFLVKAINDNDLTEIDRIVKKNPELLNYTYKKYGSGVLGICLDLEKYNSFKKLLELGANPNYINTINHYSILIEAITPFGSALEWREDNRYAKLLLEYKANPNYVVQEFEKNGLHYSGASPLNKASSINFEMVKELIKYGANKDNRVDGELPFGEAVSSRQFDIIYYYIDSLHTDVNEPLSIVKRYDGKYAEYYIQDYIKMYMSFKPNSKSENKKQELIKKLEAKGVDFKNYHYEF